MSEPFQILLAEDHRPLAESVGAYLEAVGFVVDYAADGLTAMSRRHATLRRHRARHRFARRERSRDLPQSASRRALEHADHPAGHGWCVFRLSSRVA